MPRDADWATCGGQYALFLALDGRRDASIAVIKEVLERVRLLTVSGRFDSRCIAITQVLCALAELINGRATRAERMLQSLNTDDRIERIALKIGKAMAKSFSHRDAMSSDEVESSIETLAALDYGDIAGLLKAVKLELGRRGLEIATLSVLTPSERDVLRLLATGLLPKEIAVETARSVHTVRVHIANAIIKLDCHGRSEAIARARRLGIV
jgi:DNA-binding CsgD family transcriptional regulator